jgi:predicted transcriptional regulator
MKSEKNSRNELILQLNSRKKIYKIVQGSAGSHFREILRRGGFPQGTLKYHLNFLTRHGLIIERKDGGKTRYFSKDVEFENLDLLSLLRQKSVRNILLSLIDGPKSHGKIVEVVGLSPSTVSWHLGKLLREEVVKKSGGKYGLIIDKREIIKLLIAYRESFLDSLVDKAVEMWELT